MKTVSAPAQGIDSVLDSLSALAHASPFAAYVAGVIILAALAWRFRDSF